VQTQIEQQSIKELQAIRGARLGSLIERCRKATPWQWDGTVRNGYVTSTNREEFLKGHSECQSLDSDVLDQAILQAR